MISSVIKEQVKLLRPREALPKIINYLNLPDLIVLIGMRQTGKTSLLYLTIDYLLREGVPDTNIFYFSLDDPLLLTSFNRNIKELEIYLNNEQVSKDHKLYIFIDEIQYLKDPTTFLKYYHDNFPSFKIIVTGSSTFEIRKKFRDSLAGRKKVLQIRSLSFKEFLKFKNKSFGRLFNLENIDQILNSTVSEITKADMIQEFSEYLLFGGHPKLISLPSRDLKLAELKDIYSSYIRRDIKDIGNIENVDAYNSLVSILSSQIGSLVNIHELTNTLNINQLTIKKYVFLLENTFVINLLKPYFKNKRKELSKMPKVYFEDIGLRNMVSGDFRDLNIRNDAGAIAENFVFNELEKQLGIVDELFFWRSINKEEVDFILKKAGELIPIEVKYKNFRKPKLTVGMKYFIKKYESQKALVITKDFLGGMDFEKCKIYFIPIYLISGLSM